MGCVSLLKEVFGDNVMSHARVCSGIKGLEMVQIKKQRFSEGGSLMNLFQTSGR